MQITLFRIQNYVRYLSLFGTKLAVFAEKFGQEKFDGNSISYTVIR